MDINLAEQKSSILAQKFYSRALRMFDMKEGEDMEPEAVGGILQAALTFSSFFLRFVDDDTSEQWFRLCRKKRREAIAQFGGGEMVNADDPADDETVH